MKILIADDHATNRKLLTAILSAQNYEVQEVSNGGEALTALKNVREPLVALLDWQMPVLAGVDVCRQARKEANADLLFLVIVTVRDSATDIVEGLHAGANDYVTKPFDKAELLARVAIGSQVVQLREALLTRVKELEEAMAHIKQLKGLLPICSYCKKIRDDQDYWQEIERYISIHSDTKFSHGICPPCFEKFSEGLGFSKEDARQILNRMAAY